MAWRLRRFGRNVAAGILAVWLLFTVFTRQKNDDVSIALVDRVTESPRPRVYQYAAPYSPSIIGRAFNVSRELLDSIHFPIPRGNLWTLTDDNVGRFVILTAADNRFYGGLYSLLTTVAKHFPTYKTLVYDMGFTDVQREELTSACNVDVRKFDFTKYPPHVSRKTFYAWKPIILHEVLVDYPGVLWLDSSVRLISANLSNVFQRAVHRTHGIVMLSSTGHSNYAVTNPQMYHYFPSKTELLKVTDQWEGNSMLIYRTHAIYGNVMKWALLCALDADCIAPSTERFCIFSKDRYKDFAKCHRYDQSVINILLANLFDFDSWSYYVNNNVVRILRNRLKMSERLKEC